MPLAGTRGVVETVLFFGVSVVVDGGLRVGRKRWGERGKGSARL